MKFTPTTIFVWVNYGDIQVYQIQDSTSLALLKAQIREACEFLGLPANHPDDSIMDLICDVGGVGCHETFENGTGWKTLK
jgi:hypothetical protein